MLGEEDLTLNLSTLLQESLYAIILFTWVMIIVSVVSKKLYDYMIKKGLPHNVAVYYNRKFIHVAAGGFVAFLVPYLFTTPIIPFILAMVLATLTYIPHRKGKLMYWFQVEDNIFEVHFCMMWGIVIILAWIVFDGNFWYGVIPVLYMAVGDAVTGVVRNLLYKRRTKSWWGNLAMAIVCIPLGLKLGIAGALSGALASIVEHFEFKFIDDNITVPLTAFLTILAFYVFMPHYATPLL